MAKDEITSTGKYSGFCSLFTPCGSLPNGRVPQGFVAVTCSLS
ncbi:hypothetical protein [Flavonifractor sp. An91]|nr:hypothetical protein [Flavonifractor sp. An91]